MARARLLPLAVLTPDSWGAQALSDPLTLLNDHAHLERKAAGNALELLSRWPDNAASGEWVRVLSAIARDEVAHLAQVAKILEKRGGVMTRSHRSSYATALHAVVRRGDGPRELIDRLMISALIELRSCERFEILGRCADDPELKKLYRSLWASEHGHYKTFLSLAGLVRPAREVKRRWQELLNSEAEIIASQPAGSSIHGWVRDR